MLIILTLFSFGLNWVFLGIVTKRSLVRICTLFIFFRTLNISLAVYIKP